MAKNDKKDNEDEHGLKEYEAPPSIVWITNEMPREAFITIDNEYRFYVSTTARRILGVHEDDKFQLVIGYDSDYKRLIVGDPKRVKADGVKPFKFGRRANSRAKPFVDRLNLTDSLPVRYEFISVDYAGVIGAYAFELVEAEGGPKA